MKTIVIGFLVLVFGFWSEAKAQVTTVGSYNVELVPGLTLVGLHVDYGNRNSISNLFRTMVEGAELYKVVNGSFTTNVYRDGRWERPNETLELGEGVYLWNPTAQPFLNAFGGTIREGDLTNVIPAGLSIQASMVPRGGKLTQELGLRLNAFDNVYLLEGGALKVFTFLPDGTWRPTEPVVRLSEGFVINAARETNWVMHVEINQ
jgi:hypothetical protein